MTNALSLDLMKRWALCLLAATFMLGTAGCWESDAENAAEDVTESIEDTADDAGDAVEDAVD